MATTLQQQLAAIAASSTQQLDLKAQRTAHSKSLLFEPRAAATQDYDTIYQICIEGFRELCTLDRRFLPFAKTIFSEQSKSEDRNEMTAKDNEELNSVLEGFLGLVGSRILLKPAIKSIEWLVRRFRIHEYNTEFTLLTFLPYHETPVFKTLLSILPPAAKLPSTLRFLAPYETALTNPPRSAILYTAINNSAFLTTLNNYVLKIVRAHQQSASLLSFWASVVTQAIDGMMGAARSGRELVQKKKEEDLLLLILPVLNEGLTFTHSPEMVIACYMTIMVLVAKASLEEKVLDSLMEAVVKSRKTDTESSCLVCLAVIAQERRRVRFPKSVAKRLAKLRGLPEKLIQLSQQCRVERFALGYILARLDRASEQEWAAIEDVEKTLNLGLLDDGHNRVALGALIQFVQKMNPSDDIDASGRNILASSITRLANSKPLSLPWKAALKEENVELEALEMQLGTVLQITEPEDPRPDNADLPVQSLPEVESYLDAAIESLQKVEANSVSNSFLAHGADALFGEISRAFALAARPHLETRMPTILALPYLRREEAFKTPTYFSSLLRLGIAGPSAVARASAWNEIQKLLVSQKSAPAEETPDMQAFVPYIISALGDRAASVRRAAAEIVLTLKRLSKAKKETKSKKNVDVWGKKDLYGDNTKGVEWLSHEESTKLVSTLLVPNLEECILDGSHIMQVLEVALSGRAKEIRNGKESEVTELKSSLRTSIASFLASHAAQTSLVLRLPIFTVIGRIGKYGSKARLDHVLPSVRAWFSLDRESAITRCRLDNIKVSEVDRACLSAISPRDAEGVELLAELIDGRLGAAERDFHVAAVDRLKQLWHELKSDISEVIAMSLLDAALAESEDPAAQTSQENAVDILRSVPLSTVTLDNFLRSIPSAAAQMPEATPPTKRRRTSQASKARSEAVSPVDPAKNLRRLTLVLELIDSSGPEKHPELLKGLFHTLSELQHYRTQSGSNLVYLQSLVIGSLLAIVQVQSNSRESSIDTSVIRADLLVDCIRHSTSPQVQNSALLLVSNLASWQPELVLHSVMPIFTFMGSTLLRQSDDYSVHVIDQTVSRVVPPLVSSLRRKNQNFILGISDLLLSFVAAYEHIPLHRRLNLFGQLLKTLGPDSSLAATAALLFDRYPTEPSLPRFFNDLLKQFEPVAVLKSYRQYLDLVEDGLRTRRQLADTLFGFKEKKPEEIERALVNLLDGLITMLRDKHLKAKLGKVLLEDQSQATLVRQHFTLVVEKTIVLSNQVKSRQDLYQACRNVLVASLDLLPSVELVKSSEILLESPHDQVRRSTLQAIQFRIKSVKQSEEKAIRALLSLIPRIVGILRTSQDTSLRQIAVACIDEISESFGKKDINTISEAGAVVASSTSLSSQDEQLQVMSLHCLASMVEVLREEFIALLPVALPQAFEHLQTSISSASNEALHDAAYALICAVVEYLPFIFSGQYFTTALELSQRSAGASLGESAEESRRQFYMLSARFIEPKQLFTSIEQTWRNALQAGPKALDEYVELLTLGLKSSSKSAVVENTSTLYSILLHGFDFRRVRQAEGLFDRYTAEDVEHIEQRITDAVLAMILKLNDATFRPLFIQLVEWTSKKLPKADSAGRLLRSISFYRFLCAFFERLKSLVTSYSSYVLGHSVRLLKNASVEDEEAELLNELVLQSLAKSFEYDEDDFWQSPNHFSAIAEPLVQQLTHDSPRLVNEFAIPAITELANAASSAENHKELNAMIMKCMRAQEPHTRLAATKCEQSLTEKIGEEWLGLLPEMLPYISELQDDDNELVEREIQRWIKRIEEILGESLDAMLQ